MSAFDLKCFDDRQATLLAKLGQIGFILVAMKLYCLDASRVCKLDYLIDGRVNKHSYRADGWIESRCKFNLLLCANAALAFRKFDNEAAHIGVRFIDCRDVFESCHAAGFYIGMLCIARWVEQAIKADIVGSIARDCTEDITGGNIRDCTEGVTGSGARVSVEGIIGNARDIAAKDGKGSGFIGTAHECFSNKDAIYANVFKLYNIFAGRNAAF